ncbi:MAG: dephospho-CoA kinase [Candidatus Dormibacteria bacterium]
MSRLIGLTGGVASGKSTVAQMLQERGARVVDADQLARRAVETGSPALMEIRQVFGEGVMAQDGTLDRAELGRLVFADARARAELERVIHPLVADLSREEIRQAKAEGVQVVVYDVPLLYETAREDEFEGVVVVYVDPEVQLLRLRQRSGLSQAEALARIGAQMPLSRKRELATWVVDNSQTREATRLQVDDLWRSQLIAAE